MSYQDWQWRGSCDIKETELHLRVYLNKPETLTLERIKGYDQSAARAIQQAEELIADLREYRQALAARYAQLETAAYTLRLELIRHPAWSGIHGVSYDLRLIKRYEDGTESAELSEHYRGKERHAALARFEELCRQRPGIEIVKDIERRSWER